MLDRYNRMRKRGVETADHKNAVAALGVNTRGFNKALAGILDEPVKAHFVPDGYIINKNNRLVTIYEVCVSNPPDDEKMRKIAWLWFVCDCSNWSMNLLLIDRFGGKRLYSNDDLCAEYYTRVLKAS